MVSDFDLLFDKAEEYLGDIDPQKCFECLKEASSRRPSIGMFKESDKVKEKSVNLISIGLKSKFILEARSLMKIQTKRVVFQVLNKQLYRFLTQNTSITV